jgi:tetratricopeptide (TPR) repeat protein
MEKILTDIGRLLETQEFHDLDEANAFLHQLAASGAPVPSAAARTPLEEAQNVMYDAFEATGEQRIQLARKALSICEDCADAYVLLAEESAESLQEAADWLAAGVEAGKRALGEEFAEAEGNFWFVVKTRPYLRARAGLASALWQLGQHLAAIDHYEDMLRLNPGDHQGIRYLLLTAYLVEGQDGLAERLLDEYPDDPSAIWPYHRALLLYRQEKSGPKASAQLREALRYNPHVPDYLLGHKPLPDHLPSSMGFGDEEEAAYYTADAGSLWTGLEGALDWLQRIASGA